MVLTIVRTEWNFILQCQLWSNYSTADPNDGSEEGGWSLGGQYRCFLLKKRFTGGTLNRDKDVTINLIKRLTNSGWKNERIVKEAVRSFCHAVECHFDG